MLSNEERNLLSVTCKNMVEGRRAAGRVISGIDRQEAAARPDYQEKVESELWSICTTVLD